MAYNFSSKFSARSKTCAPNNMQIQLKYLTNPKAHSYKAG